MLKPGKQLVLGNIAAAEGAIAAMAVEKQLHERKQLAVDWAK